MGLNPLVNRLNADKTAAAAKVLPVLNPPFPYVAQPIDWALLGIDVDPPKPKPAPADNFPA